MLFTLVSASGLIAFIYREISIDYPAVNLRLYRNYNLVIGSIMNLVLGMLLFSTIFIFPLFTQISLGWTATQTGLFFIPGALCTAVAMPLVANLLGRGANPKTIIILGILMTSLFLVMLSYSSPDSNEWNFYFPFILRGFGLAFMMSPILSLAIQGLSGKDMAQAVGLANMIRQLGGAVGIALINVFLTNQNAQIRGNMLSYVTESSSAAADRIAMMTQNFLGAGYAPGDAEILAYKMMDNAVLKQNFMVGYNLGYLMLACSVLASIPVVLLIRYKKTAKPAVVKDAH
jgi:DHA2 family multidrug resistance protein